MLRYPARSGLHTLRQHPPQGVADAAGTGFRKPGTRGSAAESARARGMNPPRVPLLAGLLLGVPEERRQRNRMRMPPVDALVAQRNIGSPHFTRDHLYRV